MAKFLELNDPQYLLGFWHELHVIKSNNEKIIKEVAIAEARTIHSEAHELIKQIDKDFSKAELYVVINKGDKFSKELVAAYTPKNKFEDYFNSAVHNYEIGNIPEAMNLFTKCIEISPNDSRAYTNRGLMSYIRNDYSTAINDFNKAIELDNNSVDAYYNRGLSYKEAFKYKEALADFHKVRTINKSYRERDTEAEIETLNSYLNKGMTFHLTAETLNNIISKEKP